MWIYYYDDHYGSIMKKLEFVFFYIFVIIGFVSISMFIYIQYIPICNELDLPNDFVGDNCPISLVFIMFFYICLPISFAGLFKHYRTKQKHKKFAFLFFVTLILYTAINLLIKYMWF